MIGRTQVIAFTHCFKKNFLKSYKKWSTFLNICAFTYSIFGQMGFRKHTCKDKKHLCNSLLFMLCHLMVYTTLQDTLFHSHLVKKKWSPTPTYQNFMADKGIGKVTSRFCKDTNSCEPTLFEQVVIQNDQVERINNLSILQGSTYRKQVGHSIEFNEKTPLCKRCFTSRFKRLFPSDTKISASQINQCQKCSDWWMDSEAVRLSISFMHKFWRICTFTIARTRDNQPNSACSLQDIILLFTSGLQIYKISISKERWLDTSHDKSLSLDLLHEGWCEQIFFNHGKWS